MQKQQYSDTGVAEDQLRAQGRSAADSRTLLEESSSGASSMSSKQPQACSLLYEFCMSNVSRLATRCESGEEEDDAMDHLSQFLEDFNLENVQEVQIKATPKVRTTAPRGLREAGDPVWEFDDHFWSASVLSSQEVFDPSFVFLRILTPAAEPLHNDTSSINVRYKDPVLQETDQFYSITVRSKSAPSTDQLAPRCIRLNWTFEPGRTYYYSIDEEGFLTGVSDKPKDHKGNIERV